MRELTQNQKLMGVVLMTGYYAGFQCAVTVLSAICGSNILDYEYDGYRDSSEFVSRAVMGGLVYGAAVGFVWSVLKLCCLPRAERDDKGAVVNFVIGIALSGLIGYGMSKNDNDFSLGKFMAALSVGGAVIAIPVIIMQLCCEAGCVVCIDSLLSSRLLSTNVDESTTTTIATVPGIFAVPVTVEDVVVNGDNNESIQHDDDDVEAQNSQAIVVARKVG